MPYYNQYLGSNDLTAIKFQWLTLMGYRYAPDFPAEMATALALLKSSIL
jgi:hypothetical protein